MFGSKHLLEKWGPVLDVEGTPEIKDAHKKAITAVILENTEKALAEERQQSGFMSEAVANNNTGNVANWDPILISLVRRAMPNIIAYDIAGVQPMTGPTGLIFAMKSKYVNAAVSGSTRVPTHADLSAGLVTQAQFDAKSAIAVGALTADQEALHNRPDTSFSGTDHGLDHTHGIATSTAETLGQVGNLFGEMSFSIEKTSVEAKSRALKAEYTMELAQDLKAIHGLDAESELANILSTEILNEINREIIEKVNVDAKRGISTTVANNFFDLRVAAAAGNDGRWAVERYKNLLVFLDFQCNTIAKTTRRGRGNFMICSSNVASALSMTGALEYAPALATGLTVDETGSLFAGVINGRIKVFIDPYADTDYITVGYKGVNPYDAGLFYCPYVPLQMMRTIGQDDFQPRIGFKTRYGMVSNPFVAVASNVDSNWSNDYFRQFGVKNL